MINTAIARANCDTRVEIRIRPLEIRYRIIAVKELRAGRNQCKTDFYPRFESRCSRAARREIAFTAIGREIVIIEFDKFRKFTVISSFPFSGMYHDLLQK